MSDDLARFHPLNLRANRARKSEEISRQAEESRQQILLFKRVFGSPDGQKVLQILMKQFYFCQPLPQPPSGGSLADAVLLERGARMLLEDMMSKANVDIVQFDRILKGEG